MQSFQSISELLDIDGELTQADEKAIFDYYRVNPSIELRNKIIIKNMKLIYKIAGKYSNCPIDIEDICQEGVFGLMTAIEKFDTSSNARFSTYAYHWIRHTMNRYIENNGRTIRMPSRLIEEYCKIKTAVYGVHCHINSPDYWSSLSKETGFSEEKIKRVLQEFNAKSFPVSINQNISDGAHVTELQELLPDSDTNGFEETVIFNQDMIQMINELKSITSEKEYDILFLRYGLCNSETHTLQQVGQKFGMSDGKVRRIEQKSFKRLKNGPLKKYLNHII